MFNSNRLQGLDGLRCFAALAVLVFHIELWSSSNVFSNVIKENLGLKGVNLFFVLSGFLITYLLQKEIEINGYIKIKSFYIRRITRIWPLYFLILSISYFIALIITQEKLNLFGLILCLTVSPHVALVLAIQPFWASQLWSIGVEEQYYLVWPWILRKSSTKNLSKIILLSLCGVLGLKLSLWYTDIFLDSLFLDLTRSFFYWFRIETILIGALASVLWYQKNKLIGFVVSNYARYLTLILIIIIMLFKGIGPVFSAVDATVFAVLVVQVVEKPWPILENKIVKYLGRISYGLYMYHDLAIIISIQGMAFLFPSLNPGIYSGCLYLFTLGLSFIAAVISFHYFEEPLRLSWNKSLKD